MAFQVFRLGAGEADDDAKLQAFIDKVNDHEEAAKAANLVTKAELNIGPASAVYATFSYALADVLNQGQIRPALGSEVKAKFDRAANAAAKSTGLHVL